MTGMDPLTEVTLTQRGSSERAALVRRGIWLSYATIGYNTLEAIGSLVAGVLAGSVALVGFGIDSVIEVTASLAAQWRLRSDVNPSRRQHAELQTFRIVGFCFVALAAKSLRHHNSRDVGDRDADSREEQEAGCAGIDERRARG